MSFLERLFQAGSKIISIVPHKKPQHPMFIVGNALHIVSIQDVP